MREFNALIKADTIPLTNYILDGKFSNNKVENSENDAGSEKMVFNPLASGGDALPVGFRISVKSKMNNSQQPHSLLKPASSVHIPKTINIP